MYLLTLIIIQLSLLITQLSQAIVDKGGFDLKE